MFHLLQNNMSSSGDSMKMDSIQTQLLDIMRHDQQKGRIVTRHNANYN